MPDVEKFSEEETSDSFDLDFRVVYLEETRLSKGPRPDLAGGGCSGGVSDGPGCTTLDC